MKSITKRLISILIISALSLSLLTAGFVIATSNDASDCCESAHDESVLNSEISEEIEPRFRCNHSCGGFWEIFFWICNCSTAWSCDHFRTGRCPR